MKDNRIFAIKVNKDRVEPESNEASTKAVSKTEPEKVEDKKAKPEKVESRKTEPEKVEAEKVKPEKVEPKKTEPKKAKSGDDGYVTEFGTFYSIEEFASFFKEQVREWRELQGRQKDDYSELYDLFEGEKKKNGSLEASLEDLKKENGKLEGDMEVAKKQYAEGVLIGGLIKDAEEVAKSAVDIFDADIRLAKKQRNDAVTGAQSEYDKVYEEYEAAKNNLAVAEKLLKKELKGIESTYLKEVEAASEKLKNSFSEEFKKKKEARKADAEANIAEREAIEADKVELERDVRFAEEYNRSLEKRKANIAERERKKAK